MQPATQLQESSEQVSIPLNKGNRILLMFKKNRKKIIVVLILIVAVLGAVQALNSQQRGILVSTAEVTKTDFEQNVFATGKLEVKDKAEFNADSNTVVTDVLVRLEKKLAKDR